MESLPLDISGDTRIYATMVGGGVDIGAYENAGPTSTEMTFRQTSLDLFPNPAYDRLNIRTAGFAGIPVSIYVYDILGRRVSSQTITTTSATVDVSALASGVYYVSVQDRLPGIEATTYRVVVVR